MFSRSFIKSPGQTAQDIAARANVSCESVRRSPACSGEHNYTYTHAGFRAFQHATDGNYAQNLIDDFRQVYEEGNTTLRYHVALTALHHKTATTSVTTLLSQIKTTNHLVHMHDTQAPPTPAPLLTPSLVYARSQHLLDKMQFALPPHHPKTLVIFRECGVGAINFDPTQLPSERRFVKTCCNRLSSADTCGCHVGSSYESVWYVNACGESITAFYYHRKNDYFNSVYRMWGDDSDREKNVPHSPKSEVSETEVFPPPRLVSNNFENDVLDALEENHSGFTYVWKNKSHQRRFERRQRRRQQLASGELPKYGLIIVNVDTYTDETRAAKRQRNKTAYEKIRAEVHAQAIKEGTLAPASTPTMPRFNTTGLLPFQIRRFVCHEHKEQAIRDIQRPLSDASIMIAHAASRLQVTEISALKNYQRTRLTAFASFAALLAIRFSAEKGHTASFATILHHRMIQHILRRATGTEAVADKIAAPYLNDEKTHLLQMTDDPTRRDQLLKEMKQRFSCGIPVASHVQPEYRYGPIEFRRAKYYAQKCVELVGDHDDPTTAAKWAHLRSQVQRIRRGEIDYLGVHAFADHNNWVYAIHYTYAIAVREFLAAVDRWRSTQLHRQAQDRQLQHQRDECWHNSKEIRICASRKVQTTLMVREMYRFIIKMHKLVAPEFISVFGLNRRYLHTMVNRTNYLAYYEGDEASALMFGFLVPSMMTPSVHLDICVQGHVFQDPDLYVKMSDPVFGPIKKQLRDMIPSRHTGTIDRTTLMDEPKQRCRA